MEKSFFYKMTASEIRDKYYQDVPEQDYRQLVFADPTSKQEKDKMGKYGQWILSLYKQGKLKTGDIPELKDSLSSFNKFKNKLEKKDITEYRSVSELYNAIKQFEQNPNQILSKSDELRRKKQEGAVKVYEDDKWLVVILRTKEASCLYGKGTKWCTAATDGNNMFDFYNERGPLYVNINKKTGRKFQFHFQTGQLMDEQDERIEYPVEETIGMTDGMLEYYRDNVFFSNLFFNGVTAMRCKRLVGKWMPIDYKFHNKKQTVGNYIDESRNLMFPLDNDIFDADSFSDGVGRIVRMSEEKYETNFVDENGNLLFKEWIADLDFGSFDDGFVNVRNKEMKWNYMRKDGTFLFDDFHLLFASSFLYGYAKVAFDDWTENVIDKNGTIIYPFNFKYIIHNGMGYSIVTLMDGTDNGIRPDGTFFSDEPMRFLKMLTGNGFYGTKYIFKTKDGKNVAFNETGEPIPLED